jgi:hypothetical protein
MTDPRHLFWKRDGRIPAEDEVAQKFFFESQDGPPVCLNLRLQLSGNGPTFVFDRVPIRITPSARCKTDSGGKLESNPQS